MKACKYCGRKSDTDLCDRCTDMFEVCEEPESYTSVRVRVNYD